MHLLVVFSLFTTCFATPQGYSTREHLRSGLDNAAGFNNVIFVGTGFGGEFKGEIPPEFSGVQEHEANLDINCGQGQIRHFDGSCIEPIVDRNYFVYNAPDLPINRLPPPEIPPPKVKYNVVFVRKPEGPEGLEPIVVPLPQQKTLVYVLSKNVELSQQVIEVPAGPEQTPEIFYINYDEGDNPSLLGGVDLQTVLASTHPQKGHITGGEIGSEILHDVGASFGDVGRSRLRKTHEEGFVNEVSSTNSTKYVDNSSIGSISVSRFGSTKDQPLQYFEYS